MGNWRGHNACNRFDDTKVFAQKEIARFKHFQDRYGNQLESLRLEGILYRDLESKIDDMKYNFTMTNNEVKYLEASSRTNISSNVHVLLTNFRCDFFVMP